MGTFPGYRGDDELKLYVAHIEAGVKRAAANENALLVFSGGATRLAAGPRSEAVGYWTLAEQSGWFGAPHVSDRAVTEEFARDSFENVINPICRFRQFVGEYPERVCVSGFGFKAERFAKHAHAVKQMGVPEFAFEYIAVNDPPAYLLESSLLGEAAAIRNFSSCPFGNSGELREKRMTRDPYRRGNPYVSLWGF
jgi:hypothetical protein